MVDIGMGNVGSVANMVRKVGGNANVVTDPGDLTSAQRVILPGVGAFDEAMIRLRDRGFVDSLNAVVVAGRTPILGICLGMQLLAERSGEGVEPGLGWIRGSVDRLSAEAANGPRKVPHMGWSKVRSSKEHPLLGSLDDQSRFYFVHSYALCPADDADALLVARYGGTPFVAAVARGPVMGVQFHPEKSHRHGMGLMKSFLQVGH
ncbi:MAG: imidazole glycerol phosphate synthase subunit HisH [Aquihabitans sp.]